MLWFWACAHMPISVNVQYDGGSLPDIMSILFRVEFLFE